MQAFLQAPHGDSGPDIEIQRWSRLSVAEIQKLDVIDAWWDHQSLDYEGDGDGSRDGQEDISRTA